MLEFSTYSELTEQIMFEIADRANGKIGVSERSVSRYVETENERRVRISDHDATASCGGNIVYEIDIRGLHFSEVIDDFGDFDHIEVENDYLIGDWVNEAVERLVV